MASNSKIEWTHHTFNPWRGCTKVSAGCANCYAEKMSGRNPRALGVWGPRGTRVVAAESYWRQPLAWDKAAKAAGEQHRVFCASLADVFEGPDTMPAESWPEVRAARVRLFDLIRRTPHLHWLLLTKRPENWRPILEETLILAEGGDPDDRDWFHKHGDDFCKTELGRWINDWLGDEPPANVWLGTSVEDQDAADKRIPQLLRCPAAVRFLSCEPLLGAVDVSGWLWPYGRRGGNAPLDLPTQLLHWVIVGGESGPNARPMHPDWVRSLRDQCQEASVAFFFKQWGEWLPLHQGASRNFGHVIGHQQTHGVEHEGRLVHRFTVSHGGSSEEIIRVGKKAAGRQLDGREWNELPSVASASLR